MATNLKSMVLSYGTYTTGLGVGSAVGRTSEEVEAISKAAEAAYAVDPTTHFVLKWFPEAVARGDLYVLDGGLFYQGISFTVIFGIVVSIISIAGLVGRFYFDWSIARINRKIKEAELEDLEELEEWSSSEKKK
ncbi:hypothetical protein [Vibrio phage vB_VmeM-Yong XC32]|nr:hypothetical protein [Vibrio phage vB_VmeM-Yong XC31]QAX96313.1 hypothetical protein [Vibrio phage vB_VmeM-Yong XC32]QAX96631.1 hypothetical protein [Vibrio phage vB_VmeM-Yong MS31]QAX96949.1 hypothetical protein [Vibrio phage vB_VmeM-Yong MS32]